MITKFIEATNENTNWGKFMVARFSPEEWEYKSRIGGRSIIGERGWSPKHIFVLDLQTGEGAIFMPGGFAKADISRHQIWICPLFEPFLNWLYQQNLSEINNLPPVVKFTLKEAPFEMYGHRRPGPKKGARNAMSR